MCWLWILLLAMAPMTVDSTTLEVDHTWDGVPLDAPQATVTLIAEPQVLRVEVDARYHGDPPPPGPPGSTERLWRFEVVEVFLAGAAGDDGSAAYTEIELGPHGHYLVLRLEGVRQVIASGLTITFESRIEGGRWLGVAVVPWTMLPPGLLHGNAFAIHGSGASRRYRAAFPVPGEAPDFHQPSRFRPLGIKQPSLDTNSR